MENFTKETSTEIPVNLFYPKFWKSLTYLQKYLGEEPIMILKNQNDSEINKNIFSQIYRQRRIPYISETFPETLVSV